MSDWLPQITSIVKPVEEAFSTAVKYTHPHGPVGDFNGDGAMDIYLVNPPLLQACHEELLKLEEGRTEEVKIVELSLDVEATGLNFSSLRSLSLFQQPIACRTSTSIAYQQTDGTFDYRDPLWHGRIFRDALGNEFVIQQVTPDLAIELSKYQRENRFEGRFTISSAKTKVPLTDMDGKTRLLSREELEEQVFVKK